MQPSSAQTSQPQRILVVDDEALMRHLNVTMLTAAGYHVEAAEDGSVAWDSLQLKSYDLIITDNAMPRMTGLELIERMFATGIVVPIIMASGTIPKQELTQRLCLQPVTTLPKPYTSVKLLETVKKVLAKPSP